MTNLNGIARDLSRLMRREAAFVDGEIVVLQNGEEIFVCGDDDFDRFVLYSELAKFPKQDRIFAAMASVAVNEMEALRCAVMIGVPLDDDCAIVGRSFECARPDGATLLAEINTFAVHLSRLREAFRIEFETIRQVETDRLAQRASTGSTMVKM